LLKYVPAKNKHIKDLKCKYLDTQVFLRPDVAENLNDFLPSNSKSQRMGNLINKSMQQDFLLKNNLA